VVTEPRTILITGATDGLGYSLAHQVVAQGDTVVLHGRNPVKLDETTTSISELYGVPRPIAVLADLADLAQVRQLGADIRTAVGRLDVLVNNAGIGAGEPEGRTRRVSADGYELRFAVNYLAGLLLTLELLPLLRSSAPARVVNVASIRQEPLDFGDLMLERHYSGVHAYGQSKLAQVMGGFELAARVPANEVTVNSLHPATYMPTKMVLKEVGDSIDSLEEGVATTLRLVSGPEVAEVTGKFFDRAREAKAIAQAYDPAARSELWARSLTMIGHPGP
jgi:NAD(P)-dependent dehydrogenase (short-subunit alcohol dehydrogenase family)